MNKDRFIDIFNGDKETIHPPINYKSLSEALDKKIKEYETENKILKDKIAQLIYGEDHPDEVEKCEQCEDEFGGELVDGRCRNCRDNDFDKYGGR
jgi:cell division protein FtsB